MFDEELKRITRIEDQVKKRAVFAGLFSRIFRLRGITEPIIVGGEALEIYTQGGYASGDIDIKSPLEATREILTEMGFIERGSGNWYNADLDLLVDWTGTHMEEGPEAEKRVLTMTIGNDSVRLVSIEDLMIDRLNAAVHWKDSDSGMWAEHLISVAKGIGIKLDVRYLRSRAKQEDVAEELEIILERELS